MPIERFQYKMWKKKRMLAWKLMGEKAQQRYVAPFYTVVPGGTGDFCESFYYGRYYRIGAMAAMDAFIKHRKRWITVV